MEKNILEDRLNELASIFRNVGLLKKKLRDSYSEIMSGYSKNAGMLVMILFLKNVSLSKPHEMFNLPKKFMNII